MELPFIAENGIAAAHRSDLVRAVQRTASGESRASEDRVGRTVVVRSFVPHQQQVIK